VVQAESDDTHDGIVKFSDLFQAIRTLSILDGLWHLLNFFAPAFGVALLSTLMAKLLWRSELQHIPWRRLVKGAVLACIAILLSGLLFFGRDGKMLTYGAMVVACAVSLWWRGFVSRGNARE
jgi:hypothetical protein